MQIRHRSAILFSGFIWFAIGMLLLFRGLQYLAQASEVFLRGQELPFSVIGLISRHLTIKPLDAIYMVLSFAFLLGIAKGRLAMRHTVNRIVNRIRQFPSPFHIKHIYGKSYYVLMISMSCVGIVFKFLPIPIDLKGFFDATIGVALINGGILYTREAYAT